MNRYVAFLDILGFSPLVDAENLASVKNRINVALQSVAWTKSVASIEVFQGMKVKPFRFFSFSDTFVLLSEDDSNEALVSFLIGSTLLTRHLFAQTLPVRGAITFGEADFVDGTDHAVGKAIIKAHQLEKKQEWLGVLVDVPSLPEGALPIFGWPLFEPLFSKWNVPVKGNAMIENALVVNWRFGLTVEKGTKSLFRPSNCEEANKKIQNTLAFAKRQRDTNRHIGQVRYKGGNVLTIPWLNGITTQAAGTQNVVHGDDH